MISDAASASSTSLTPAPTRSPTPSAAASAPTASAATTTTTTTTTVNHAMETMLPQKPGQDELVKQVSLGAADAAGLTMDFDPKFDFLAQGRALTGLEWKGLKYTIGTKEILHGISGQALPGDVVALMGPSGAGKTTLLNVLAGRVGVDGRKKKLEGELLVNGKVVAPSTFRKQVAYVMQEDALYATATARESLEFSAKLRLPSRVTDKERKLIVDDILDSLGLTKVQDTMVGSVAVRGLSGGEKKRVAIGVELVSAPSVLMLDEPTSGLDSVAAWKVVRILKALANAGGKPTCTVVCSIHQPSSEVFAEFSHLIMLGQGHVIYQGSVPDLPNVLATKGFVMPPLCNPADFAMLCIQTKPLDSLPRDNENKRGRRPSFLPSTDTSQTGLDADVEGQPGQIQKSKSTRISKFYSSAVGGATLAAEIRKGDAAKAGFFVQSWLLAKREFKNLWRDQTQLAGRVGTVSVMAVLVAIIFLNVADQSSAGYSVNNAFGALVVSVMMLMFGAAQPAILQIPVEKVVFMREYATNTYGIGPYMSSKLLVEIPYNFIIALYFVLITYWAVGFTGNFGVLLVWLWITELAGISVAYVLGALCSRPEQAIELAPLVFVPQFLFLNVFVSVSQIPVWLRWAKWLCFLVYSVNLVSLNEFYFNTCTNANSCAQWPTFFERSAIDPTLNWLYALLIFVLIVGFRTIAFFVLWGKARSFGQ